MGRVIGPAADVGKEWVGDVGNDQADGACVARRQSACDAAGTIIEPVDDFLDTVEGGAADFALAVERARNRLPGYPGLTRNISNGDAKRVLLQPKDFDGWLNGTAGIELMRPAPENYLQTWPVSRRVNSSRAPGDDLTLIDRVAA